MAKTWKDWLFGENAFEEPIYSRERNLVIDKLREVAQGQGDIDDLRRRLLDRNLRSLKDLSQHFMHSPQLVMKEWEAAKRFVLPHEGELGDFKVLPEDPFPGIEITMRKSGSLYRDEVYSRFAANLRTILRSGAVDVLGNLTEAQLVGYMERVDSLLPEPAILKKEPFDIKDQRLRAIIQEISDTLGVDLKVERRGLAGEPGELIFTEQGGKRVLFSIPEAFAPRPGDYAGLVRQGSTLQNIYAPGVFATVDETGQLTGELETFSELKARKILEAVQAYKSGEFKGTLRAAIAATEEEVNKLLEFMEPSIGFKPGDFSLETIYKANQLTVFNAKGEPLRGQAQRDFLTRYAEQLKLSPVAGQGKFGLLDPEELYGGFYNEQDYARKPWQFIRQFRPTEQAQAAIRSSAFGGTEWDFLDSPIAIKEFNGPSGPRLKTLYLSDEQIRHLSEVFNMPIGDGELLINSKMAEQAQVARRRRISLSEINNHLTKELMKRGITLSKLESAQRFEGFEFEGILGRNIEGALESVERDQRIRIIGVAPVINRGPEGTTVKTLDLLVEEILDLSGLEKLFGSLKGMARKVDFSRMATLKAGKETLASYLGIAPNELATFGAIGRLDDLKKDPSKLLMQKFSDVMMQAPEDILKESSAHLERIRSLPTIEQQEAAIAELGSRFGYQPTGLTIGISRLHFGGTKEFTGAGNMGTMEPRILTLLEGGAFGSSTDDLGKQLLARVMAAHPDKYLLHQELGKTLESIAGRRKPGVKDLIIDPAEATPDDMARVRRSGFWMKTNIAEIPYVYIPGYEKVPALRPIKIGSGEMVESSPVSKIFRDIENDIRMLRNEAAGYDVDTVLANFTRDNTGYISRLAREYAIAGKGAGALTRGNLIGSRFLTAASDIGERPSSFYKDISKMDLPDPNLVVGIPEEYGLQMIKEMSDIYDADAMEDMAKRFQKGELIGGAIARHPFIGPYSMQPVLMKKVNTPEPVILVPEKMKDITIHLGDQTLQKQITGGVLTGMALDKDADIVMAIALDPKLEGIIRTELTTPNSELMRAMDTGLREMEDHSIRMQLLKAKKGDAAKDLTLNQLQKMAADKSKLSVVDEEVGRVSARLQRARQAIVDSSLDRSAQLQALGLLEWLEQQPISGKHLSQNRVLSGEFERQMFMIRTGAGGDPRALINTVREMVLPDVDESKLTQSELAERRLAEAMLGEGIEVTIDGQKRFVKGIELEKTAYNISRSLDEYINQGLGKRQATIDRFISIKGAQSINLETLGKFLDANNLSRDGFNAITREAMAAINKATASARSKLKPLGRPALIAATALGMGAFLLSGPPGILPPPPNPEGEEPPQRTPQMRAPMASPHMRNSSRDEVQPGFITQQLGAPTAPGMAPNSATVIDNTGPERRQAFRTQIYARGITPKQREELGRRLGANFGGDINMTLVDSRRSLSHRTVSDMLEE